MSADFKNQKAILEEYINQFYVEHFEDMEGNTNRIAALQTIEESRDWIYKGKLGYVVDSDGYVHYFLIIENFPKEIRDQIKVGLGEKKYSDYVNCNDVWGLTDNLKVYYCKNGQNSIDGVELGNLNQENGEDEVFKAGSPLAKKITGNETDNVTKSDLRGISSFTLDKTTGVENLNDMYNFPDLMELKIQDLKLTSLNGIEYLPKLKRIYIIRSTSSNYNSLRKIPEQINYLFFEDTNNDEIEKFCSYENGVGCDKNKSNGADFKNLAYFGIYGTTHFEIDFSYTSDFDSGSGHDYVKHADFSDVSFLSNLSIVTKERISNLFLNNNSIDKIENLWEFKNVTLLRIEGNNLINLNGLYNPNADSDGTTDEEKGTGMINLLYLFANSNLLGKDESDKLDLNNDGLSNLSRTSYDGSMGKYNFNIILKNLRILIISQNSGLKHLEYLYGLKDLSIFKFSGMNSLYLQGLQEILDILEKDGLQVTCDSYVSEYIRTYSKKINVVTLDNESMTIDEFRSFFVGRESYLKRLEIYNLTLTNDGSNVTNITNPSFDEIINDVLSPLVNLQGIYVNSSYLENIDFVKNMKTLYQIDLRGTHVSDLDNLVSIGSLASVIVDYSEIKIADADNLINPAKPASAIEKLYNSTYDRSFDRTYLKYWCEGVMLNSKNLLDQLKYSTHIEKFKSFAYNYPTTLKEDLVYDLSNTKITDCFIFGFEITTGSTTFKLPVSMTKCRFRNSRTTSARYKMILDDENAKTLVNLKTVTSDNNNFDDMMTFACKLPGLKDLSFYTTGYNDFDTMAGYADKLKDKEITSLTMEGWNSVKNTNPISYEKLKDISKIISLKNLTLTHFGNLNNFSFLNSLTNLESLCLSDNNLNSLSFLKNLKKLTSLKVDGNESLNINGFDELGMTINNLDCLKEAFENSLRSVDISSTGITNEEIIASDIKSLEWTSFLP